MKNDDILNDPCPICGKVGLVHLVHRDEEVKVRGQVFTVQAEVFHCEACEADFTGPDNTDSLDQAYRKYREVNGLLQPEALKAWRKLLGLKQSELALLVGWSTATVSRYENGALQDDAHDRSMRAAMTPGGLAGLVESAQGLSEDVLRRLRAQADERLGSATQLTAVVTHRISHAAAGALSWKKVSEAVVFFSYGRGVTRTKLNKLLFYTDFVHVKHFGVPVTGLPYVRLPHGPVPDDYELVFSALAAEGLLDITEALFGEYVSYVHRARRGPDIGVFSTTEMQALVRVQAEFEHTSAKDISDRSHTEDAWTKTPAGQRISLHHAKTLSLSI